MLEFNVFRSSKIIIIRVKYLLQNIKRIHTRFAIEVKY